jgi:hypothetical protein
VQISLFAGTEARESAKVSSILKTGNLEALGRAICKHMWSPGTFRDRHRSNANFDSMDLFVADIDGGCTIEEAKLILAEFECLIGTSRSHQKQKDEKPPCDRFRVLIPLAEPITSDADFKATWFKFHELLPAIDPACKDAARFYYPCTSTTPVRKLSRAGQARSWRYPATSSNQSPRPSFSLPVRSSNSQSAPINSAPTVRLKASGTENSSPLASI